MDRSDCWRGVSPVLALLACAWSLSVAQSPAATRSGQRSVPAPPLYQRLRADQGEAVSMIHGVGEMGAPPPQAVSPGRRTLQTANPSCAEPPSPEQLQPFSVFQWMEKRQATDLGILFRAADGAERPFLGNEALVWRSGAIAACLSAEGTREVVYGWEWDIGVVVQSSDAAGGASTFVALERQRLRAGILAFGESVNGSVETRPLLPEALTRLSADWQGSSSGHLSRKFLEHFKEAQKAGSPTSPRSSVSQAIGVLRR